MLSVAIFRGSANANTERLAALLSLDARWFTVSLYTTQLARGDAEQLRRATEARGRRWHRTLTLTLTMTPNPNPNPNPNPKPNP